LDRNNVRLFVTPLRIISLLIVFAVFFPTPGLANTLSAKEAREFSAALKAVEQRSKKRLDIHARRLHDPLARKIVSWYVLFQGGFGTDFEPINRFINENPNWPRRERLIRRAEEAITGSPDFIIKWFGDRYPISTLGKTKLGQALLDAGQPLQGKAILRDVWINGNFAKAEEARFYKSYRKHLTRVDHRVRAERLMWEGRYWPARRMMTKVDAQYRKLIDARTSLRRQRGNVDYLVKQVPAKYKNDPGLIYERLRWRRKKDKDNAIELFKGLPDTVPHANRWWDERNVLARRALRKGHITEAYDIASRHGLTTEHAADHAAAEWLSGWIALSFLDEPKIARDHFKKMYDGVSFPVSRARGAYWLGRSYEAQSNTEQATVWYTAAANHPTAYYGQLAAAKLEPGAGLRLHPEAAIPEDIRQRFNAHELVRAVRMLASAGEEKRLRSIILRIASLDEAPGWQALTARLARLSRRPDLAIRVAKNALQDFGVYVAGGYPTLVPPRIPKRVKSPQPETPLVLALIRQESEFDAKAESHAGARGLMQLMPATAKNVAKSAGLKYSKYKLTADPDFNVTLGQSYIAGLLEDYDGYLPMAIAAYNAGPHRLKQWIKQFGDPRDPDVDAVDWIEMIPFTETRNYVQRILENVQVYRLRLADTEVALRLEEDLNN
jgi:soluble lytic murein transglycosylase